MTILKTLTFATLPKRDTSPVLKRRNKMIARLEEQKHLLTEPSYVRVTQKWVKDANGQKQLTEKRQRVLPWWQLEPNGACLLVLRSGSKTIEFEKGKAAVSVPSVGKLTAIFDTLIKAIGSGELDEQLAATAKFGRPITAARKAA